MAKLPRLPVPFEHAVLKWACGLSPRTSRMLFGKPPTVDGQTLSTETHAMLTLARWSGSEASSPARASRTPAPSRATRRASPSAARRSRWPRCATSKSPGRAARSPPASTSRRLPRPSAAAPLLVYYHGGGWVIGDLDMYDGVCRLLAAASGCRVLSVDYRLAPEHPFPAAVEDAFAAFEWAVANAAALGADPARIGVGGDSAGGNMAAVVSHMARDGGGPGPAMQLLIYPVTDSIEDTRSRQLFAEGFVLTKADMDAFEAAYLPPGIDASDQRISVLKCPDLRGLPTAYVATAGFDPLRDEGEAYALRDARLRRAGRAAPPLRPDPHLRQPDRRSTRPRSAAMLEAAGALRLGLAAESR